MALPGVELEGTPVSHGLKDGRAWRKLRYPAAPPHEGLTLLTGLGDTCLR